MLQDPIVELSTIRNFIYFAEFKRIADSVDQYIRAHSCASLSVLSLLPEEGKSFIASSLALAFAEMMGRRVLLVDAANPASKCNLEEIFGIEERGETDLANPRLQSFAPGVDGLKLIDFRPLGSKAQEYRVQDVIAEYRGRYDLIIFDSAALRLSNRGNFDPWVIAARTDAAILVSSNKSLMEQSMRFSAEDPLRKIKWLGLIENQGVRA